MYLAVVAALDPTIELDPDLLARIQQHVTRREDDLAGALIGDDLLDLFAFSGTPSTSRARPRRCSTPGRAGWSSVTRTG